MEQVEPINQWLWFVVQMAKIIAWPVAFGLVIFWIRPYLPSIFSSFGRRRVEVEAFGVKARLDAVGQQNEPIANLAVVAPKSPIAPSTRAAVVTLESGLRAEIATVQTDAQNAILFRALAETHLRAGHESIYNRIFGSQLIALKALDERGTATVADARQFLAPYAERFPEMYRTYGFDQWLGFLITNVLVERTNDNLQTTTYGHDFLVYITDVRQSMDKPY